MDTFQSGESQINAVRVAKLSHAVADRLRMQILSGNRKPGESLPPEAELISIFQVSRPTLREALRILEVEGMIALSRGVRSAVVQGPSAQRAAEYAAMVMMGANATLNDLHQVRRLLEPPMVEILARKKDRSVLKELETAVNRLVAAVNASDFGEALSASNDFHSQLVRGQPNAALALIVEILTLLAKDSLKHLIDGGARSEPAMRKNFEKTVVGYERLLNLIQAGDGDGARAFWDGYMQRAAEVLQRSGTGSRKVVHRPTAL
jgi:DNA-binding FadR family transcriptional regulator